MNENARKPEGDLRCGWTTGACAQAAAAAALRAIYEGAFQGQVTITLPGGQQPIFALSTATLEGDTATAGIVKDAGDDPDVTHGAEIVVTVGPGKSGGGIVFHAGPGVGTVTLAGLPVPPGAPAINPAPRAMITECLTAIAGKHGRSPDLSITISIPGGEKLAEKTMNGRLGIVGGLSILGTTGIVRPYSCAAWISAIHSGVDVARAQGLNHIAAATGSTSEAAVSKLHGLAETALIDMGDFAGGLLKYLRTHPIERLTIAGGFGKLVKLGDGNMDLHSARSSVDFDTLARWLGDLGGKPDLVARAKQANTAMQVLEMATAGGIPIADRAAAAAREVSMATLSGGTEVEVVVFDRDGNLAGRAGAFKNV